MEHDYRYFIRQQDTTLTIMMSHVERSPSLYTLHDMSVFAGNPGHATKPRRQHWA